MSPEDDALRQHMGLLTDEALSDFLATTEAQELLSTQRQIVMLDAALWYATALNWPVFPLHPGRKAPMTRHGFQDASTDPEQIRSWWTRSPLANIGTPTGRTEQGGCGWDVIDIDGIEGFASLADLKHRDCPPDCSTVTFCDATGVLPAIHARAFTPGDPDGALNGRPRMPGRHYYTPAASTGNSSKILPGIDLRGDGGYVVCPPSVGPSGGRYSWITRPVAA